MHTVVIDSPLIKSLISGAEERILDMTGVSVKLIAINDSEMATDSTLDALAKTVSEAWQVPVGLFLSRRSDQTIMAMKQLFVMLVKKKFPNCAYLKISLFLNGKDHTNAIHWENKGKLMLQNKDDFFMYYYNQVKHLFNADTI